MFNSNSNPHIQIFKNVITTNGEWENANIVNLFCFTLCDNIFEQECFFKFHAKSPNCVFNELETTFCKHYKKMQINEQVYMWHFKSLNKKQTRKSKFIMNAF